MSKSAIYTANTSTQDVAIDGIISPGTIVRRFGPNITLSGNALQIAGAGYYEIEASITLEPSTTDAVTVTMYKDGVPVQGATASSTVATANDPTNLSITSLVREFCNCCEGLSNLTFVLTDTPASVTNIAIVVEKL